MPTNAASRSSATCRSSSAHHSAEVWSQPRLFELDADGRPSVVAGVPPDFFSATGQRWGNPLYRWAEHARDGYAWWVRRMRCTFELVDIVRIDHFRGFAGYWEIPADEPTAVHGRWRTGPGADLFKAINAALGPMPIIAEDLGVITPDVEALRRRFQFPGMRILQFAFGDDASNTFLPHHHECDTVVYPGTHDNDTCLGWWAGAAEHERRFAQDYLACGDDDMAWALIRSACASVADTAIYAMQDVLSLPGEARMNFPGQSSGWWQWRCNGARCTTTMRAGWPRCAGCTTGCREAEMKKAPLRAPSRVNAVACSAHHGDLVALAVLVGEQGQRAVLDVALLVEGDGAGDALVAVGLGQLGQVLGRIGRTGLLHGGGHHASRAS